MIDISCILTSIDFKAKLQPNGIIENYDILNGV